jgi:phosphoglycerol transferase MdoB-like AlkP superfamily enzyme
MLNMEGLSSEAKIGKILILVAIILGILIMLVLSAIGVAIYYAGGSISALNMMLAIPLFFIAPVLLVKLVGLVLGFLALHSTEQRDYNRAGILAIIASVLPPLDLVMLIGGIFCLISKEANEAKATSLPPSPPG